MIFITGASGKTGRAILRALTPRGVSIRVLVRKPETTIEMLDLGASDVIVGDMHDPQVLVRGCQGVETVYHICPNVQPDETNLGREVIKAAQAAGVGRFVYHSVLHPQIEEMPHHWNKMRVEETLFKSGLDYTILQPAAYMQNMLASWESLVNQGIYPVPYPVETRLGMVDLQDVAEAAACVLTQPNHVGAIYELSGSEALTQVEAADKFGAILGRQVRAEPIPIEEWEARARGSGMSDYGVVTLLKMFDYYAKFGFFGNAKILAWLLGREPTPFDVFAQREIRERKNRVSGKTS